MDAKSFLDYQLAMLHELCPPIEAVGIGGSVGSGEADAMSDLDFFFLLPDDDFFATIDVFPELISHRQPPVVSWRRGFNPDFGFTFSYFYNDGTSVEYMLNCHHSLRRTPMALKTRVIRDLTGYFTRYHESLIDHPELTAQHYASESAGALLAEILKISKYARRNELVAVIHRLERLRLILLALERHISLGDHYVPHDADKRVHRDLGPAIEDMLALTFCEFSPVRTLDSFRHLDIEIEKRLKALTVKQPLSDEFWRLKDRLTEQADQHLRDLSHSTATVRHAEPD